MNSLLESEKSDKNDRTLENFDLDARRESPWDTLLESMLRSIVRKGKPQELSLFDFYSIAIVTNNFSMANELGQGGYGPVYKGKPHDETDVAVKRLSTEERILIYEFLANKSLNNYLFDICYSLTPCLSSMLALGTTSVRVSCSRTLDLLGLLSFFVQLCQMEILRETGIYQVIYATRNDEICFRVYVCVTSI
ncbi:hypothetical protein SLA2020_178260 [Shorea laevis]